MDGMFDTVFDRVFGHEGGYSDNPKDPGNWTGGKVGKGKLLGTKYGIAANTYPGINIKDLTEAQAKAIYFEDWWCALDMQRFSKVMQFQMFDAAFNHGMRNASKMFQRAVKSHDDGIIGPKTMIAAKAMDDNDKVIRFLSYRLRFFTDLKTFDTFGRGWSRRVADNLLYAAEDN
jgi:lysozyme family protein